MAETVTAIVVSEEQEREIESKRLTLLEAAEGLIIDDSDSEAIGWEIVNKIGSLKKMIEQDFQASKSAAHVAWKTICGQEAGHLERLDQPNKIVRGKLASWGEEKQRILQAAQEKAQEIARKQAEGANRIAREQAEKEAEERRLQEALAAEAAGNTEEAQAILDKPLEVAPIEEIAAAIVPTMVLPKVNGAGAMVKVWKFEIVEEAKVPREFLIVDTARVGKIVAAMKDRTKIPGVRVWSELEARRVGQRFRPGPRRNDSLPRPDSAKQTNPVESPAAERGPWENE
jgi:hypothetical protein